MARKNGRACGCPWGDATHTRSHYDLADLCGRHEREALRLPLAELYSLGEQTVERAA